MASEVNRASEASVRQANQQGDALSAGILALVQNFQTVPAMPLLAAGSQETVAVAMNGHASKAASICGLAEEPANERTDNSTPPAADLVEKIASVEPSVPVPSPNFADTSALAQALEQEARVLFEAVSPQPQPDETRDEVKAELCQALESQAQLVLESIQDTLEAERSGVGAIVAAFSETPAVALLSAPSEVLKAPGPAALEWIRTARPSIPPASPQDPNLTPLTDGPLTPTLDGPCLLPQLHRFTEAGTPRLAPSRKRSGFPAWIVSFLVATVLLLGSVRLVPYLTTNRDANTDGSSPRPTAETAPSATAAVLEEHPFARFVEVAGVRVTSGASHKLQLEYIVVNHSSHELTALGIRLALRSGDNASNAAPLFTVFSKLPSLGPYQSREIRTEIDPPERAASLTDWQSIRTETLIAKAQ